MSSPLSAIDPNAPSSDKRAAMNRVIVEMAVKLGIKDEDKDKERIDPATGAVVNDSGLASSGPSAGAVVKDSTHDIGTIRTAATTDGKGTERRPPDAFAQANKTVALKGRSLKHTET